MYTFKRAVGNSRLSPKGEELLDIGAMACNVLFTNYSRIIVIVEDKFAGRDVSIDLIYYFTELGIFTGTIQQWLDTKTNVNLETSNELPGDRYRYVTTHDIQYEWFSLLPGDARIGREQQEALTTSRAPDIRVTKTDGSDVDYGEMVDRCLWTMNGHLVRAIRGESTEKCLYLLNAGRHFQVYDNIHINALNFNTVSKLQTLPFRAENIKFESRNGTSFLHVKTDQELTDKTVWASLGGRLYREDIIQIRSNKSFTIRIDKIDWFTAIFDSKRLIDLSKVIDQERDSVPYGFFETEEFLTNLLLDISSFLILLDNPHVYAYTVPMVNYQYPFTYHTEETRNIPMITANGLLPKYFPRRIINRRLLDIDIGVQRLYVGKTAGLYDKVESVEHEYTNRYKPSQLHPGFLFYIRSVIQGD